MDRLPRILFTTPVLKYPSAGGPYLRIENTIKVLSKISELSLYCRVRLSTKDEIGYYSKFCKNFYFSPSISSVNRIKTTFFNICNYSLKFVGKTLPGAAPDIEDYRDLLEKADAVHADVIWLGYGNISYPLLEYVKKYSNYKVICDTDSVWSRFILRGLPYIADENERKKTHLQGKEKEIEERISTQIADVTTAVSEVDAEYFRSISDDIGKIHLFSNVIDESVYERKPEPPSNLIRPNIFLAGTFEPKTPMDNATRWVIDEVLPLVKQEISSIHLYIIGRGSDITLHDVKDPSISITGQLPSVLPYLYHTNVSLVPLKFESGTRFKILEAGVCGIPVVSTTLGAEGIPVTPNKDILIADDASQFASSIIRIINKPLFAQFIGNNLKTLIHDKYTLTALECEAQEIFRYLQIDSKVK